MASKIEKISIVEIIEKLGFFRDLNDLRATYKFNIDQETLNRFETAFFEEMNGRRDFSKYIQIIAENSEMFDKEIYALRAGSLLLSLYEKQKRPLLVRSEIDYECPMFFPDKGKIKGANSSGKSVFDNTPDIKELKKAIDFAKDLLHDSDIVDLEFDPKTRTLGVYTSLEFIGRTGQLTKRNEKTQERLSEIEEKIGLDRIVGFLRPTDLIDICRYPNLGNWIAVDILQKCKPKQEKTVVHDRVHDTMIELDQETVSTNSKGKLFDWNDLYRAVKDNIQYIDIDKMLLLVNAVYYNKYGNDLDRFSHDEALDLKAFTDTIEGLLENKKVSIDSQKFNSRINFELIRSSVNSLNKHYIGERFYSDLEIEEFAQSIIAGENSVDNLSKSEFLDIMQFTMGDLVLMVSNNPSALKSLREKEFITEEQFKEIVSKMKLVTSEQLQYLYGIGEIDNSRMFELYNDGKISLESIKDLRSTLEDKTVLESIVSAERLVELYLDEEQKEEFDKYRRLYKLLVIDDKTIKERKEIANTILDQSLELLDVKKMEELYHMGLIPLDTYVDFNGNKAVIDLYATGELKPVDARRLYDEKIITIDAIKGVLADKDTNDGKKLVLIYSTFPDPEDAGIRDELVGYLLNPEENSRKGTSNSKRSKISLSQSKEKESNEKNRFVTDPCSRWNLLALLDSEYSQEYLKDGTAVFYLPNQGKYIIEKLYNKNNEPAYGSATYIVDEEIFENSRGEIIKAGKIDKKVLVQMKQNKKAKKIIHTGWGNGICKYFDVENPSKYTEKQTKKIQKLAKQVEDSKTLIER